MGNRKFKKILMSITSLAMVVCIVGSITLSIPYRAAEELAEVTPGEPSALNNSGHSEEPPEPPPATTHESELAAEDNSSSLASTEPAEDSSATSGESTLASPNNSEVPQEEPTSSGSLPNEEAAPANKKTQNKKNTNIENLLPNQNVLLSPNNASVNNENELKEQLADPSVETIVLNTGNIQLNQALPVALNGSRTLTLMGSGKTTLTAAAGLRHLLITGPGSLTLVMKDIVLDGAANGGGIQAENNASLTISGGSIQNCSVPVNGGGVAVLGAGASLTLKGDVSVTGNKTSQNGGGVYSGGRVVLSGSAQVNGNESAATGGGLFAQSNVSLNDTATINGNKAKNTGGLHVADGAVTLKGTGGQVSVSNNEAQNNSGGIHSEKGTVSLAACQVHGNLSETNTGGVEAVYGTVTINAAASITGNTGGEYGSGGVRGSSKDTNIPGIVMNDGEVRDNKNTEPEKKSGSKGGGLYTPNQFKMAAGTISGNSGYAGGGVAADGPVAITGGTITNNSARRTHAGGVSGFGGGSIQNATITNNNGKEGGGIFLEGKSGSPPALINNCTITGNVSEFVTTGRDEAKGGGLFIRTETTIEKCDISNNKAIGGIAMNQFGGGIYTTAKITLRNCTLEQNVGSQGGALFLADTGSSESSIIEDTSFHQNQGYWGGAIRSFNAISFSKNVSFTENSATSSAGALQNEKEATIGGNVSFIGNHTTSKVKSGSGGAIVSNGVLTVTGGVLFERNTSDYGGAIHVAGASRGLNVSDKVLFVSNQATRSGGAIYSSSPANFSGSVSFQNNKGGYGGAMMHSDEPLIIEGLGTVEGNNGEFGGVFHITDCDFTLKNAAAIKNNTAVLGGGIYYHNYQANNSTKMTLENVTLQGNTALSNDSSEESRGGGIYVEKNATVEIKNSIIQGNSTKWLSGSGRGGGIYYTNSGPLTLINTTVSNNAGSEGGGLYYHDNEALTIKNGRFYQNQATSYGGGIDYGSGGTSTIQNTMFEENNAPFGGAILSYTAFTLGEGTNFKNNTASSMGGGLYAMGATTLQKNIHFTGNQASEGGGIYAAGTLSIGTGSTFTENEADDGGGLLADGPTTVQENVHFTNNTAGGGAGIKATNILTVGAGSTFTDNFAWYDGGGIHISNLANLKTNGVSFSQNRARAFYRWDVNNPRNAVEEQDAPIHKANIIKTNYTQGFTNAYNNYDVNYGNVLYLDYYKDAVTDRGDPTHYLGEHCLMLVGPVTEEAITRQFPGWPVQYKPQHYKNAIFSPAIPANLQATDGMELTLLYEPGNGYTVIFNGNGADVEASPQTMQVTPPAENVGSLPVPPQKTGYRFLGWFTKMAGGDPFTESTIVNSDITVYAHWQSNTPPVSYTVTFDSNGADIEASPQAIQVTPPAKNVGTLPVPPQKTGYRFLGWFTQRQGGSSFTATTLVEKSITVYAHWQKSVSPVSYTVTFDGNGAEIEASPSTITVVPPDTNVGTLPIPPQKAGYRFLGWFTQRQGGSAFTATTTVNKDITVYAHWQKNAPPVSYTVIFDGNGAEVEASPNRTTVTLPDKNVEHLPIPPLRNGFTFTGWNTLPNGSGTTFTAATTVNSNITVYAQWVSNRYALSFNLNGGTGRAPASQTLSEGELATAVTRPSREGYSFLHWNTRPDGTGIRWNFAATPMPAQNITLYAQWSTNGSSTPPPSSSETPPPPSSSSTPRVPPQPPRPSGGGGNQAAISSQPGYLSADLSDGNIPLGSLRGKDTWSLLSLLFGVTGCIISLVLLIGMLFRKNHKEEPEDEYGELEGEEDIVVPALAESSYVEHMPEDSDKAEQEKEKVLKKRSMILRLLTMFAGLLAGVLFIILDNLALPISWINRWTPLIALVFIVHVVLLVIHFVFKRKANEEEQEDTNTNIDTSKPQTAT